MVITEVISMYQELDLLEAHLEESQHWADRIVIIESPVTFTSVEKPLYFDENKERFKRFNVEHIVTPPEIFTKVPFTYDPKNEEQKTKWFRARRHNRNLNRQYHWDIVRNGVDYVYFNDVDEFVSRDHWGYMEELLRNKEYHYAALRARKFNFWVNARGSKQEQYRITRSDKKEFYMQRGTPRICPKQQIGWHFTNCFHPEQLREKMIGISCHVGKPPSDVPSVALIKERLDNMIEPFVESEILGGIKEIMPKDDLSWAPKFMQDSPDLFPWLDDRPIPNNPEKSWRLPDAHS